MMTEETDTEDMSYQGMPDEPDLDVERYVWTPTELQLARYRKRELQLAAANLDLLAFHTAARHKRVITNGLARGEGYHAIAVHAGGPEPGECLHSLTTFGAIEAKHRKSLQAISLYRIAVPGTAAA